MKKFFSLALLLYVSIFFTHCSKGIADEVIDVNPPITEEEEYVVCSVKTILEGQYEAITRSSVGNGNGDLIGFQIYQYPDNCEPAYLHVGEDYRYTEVNYYGPCTYWDKTTNSMWRGDALGTALYCGYFDNTDNIEVTLSTKKMYDIVMVYMPNGQNIVHKNINNNWYFAPFTFTNLNYRVPMNQMLECQKVGRLMDMESGGYAITDGNAKRYTGADNYYGAIIGYTPKSGDGVMNIELKKMFYRLKFKFIVNEAKDIPTEPILITLNPSLWGNDKLYVDITKVGITEYETPDIICGRSFIWLYYAGDDRESWSYTDIFIGTDSNDKFYLNGQYKYKRNSIKVFEINLSGGEMVDNITDVIIKEDDPIREI